MIPAFLFFYWFLHHIALEKMNLTKHLRAGIRRTGREKGKIVFFSVFFTGFGIPDIKARHIAGFSISTEIFLFLLAKTAFYANLRENIFRKSYSGRLYATFGTS